MSETPRWLDELPWGAPERELLLAGKTARPPHGRADAEWQTLCLALGATAASGVATGGVAVSAATTKAASATLASKAVSIGSWAVGVKWFALGVALGCGTMGASAVAQHVSRRPSAHVNARSAAVALHVPARARSAAETARPKLALEVTSAQVAALSAQVPAPLPLVRADALAQTEPTSHADSTSHTKSEAANERTLPSEPLAPVVATALLAEQARELAEVKRLIDAGSASQALRRLEVARGAAGPFALSEERDALYVQALARAGRQADAQSVARDFLIRYPESPYLEAMRRLLAKE